MTKQTQGHWDTVHPDVRHTGDPFEKRFFAASNSAEGFRNYYGDCFGDGNGVARLYIIKGGPGTGKSHFMRSVGRYAAERGYDVTWYYCSSDPASLDGVMLTAAGQPTIGLLDGTAPHVCEPIIPGVREEIVNLGAFWNADTLRNASDEIRSLGALKSAAYARAYRYLAAAGETDAVAEQLIEPCVNLARLNTLATRMLKKNPTEGEFLATPALQRALGMTGWALFDTFVHMSKAQGGEVVRVEDYYGLGYCMTHALFAVSRTRGHRVLVSHDPVLPHKIDGLFYPATGLCVMVASSEDCPPDCRTISMRRYTDNGALRAVRSEVRCARRLYAELTDGACRSLAEAATHHFALEKIYSSTMDFSAEDAFCRVFCEKNIR